MSSLIVKLNFVDVFPEATVRLIGPNNGGRGASCLLHVYTAVLSSLKLASLLLRSAAADCTDKYFLRRCVLQSLRWTRSVWLFDYDLWLVLRISRWNDMREHSFTSLSVNGWIGRCICSCHVCAQSYFGYFQWLNCRWLACNVLALKCGLFRILFSSVSSS